MGEAITRQRRLEDEDQGQHRQQHGKQNDIQAIIMPCVNPGRHRGVVQGVEIFQRQGRLQLRGLLCFAVLALNCGKLRHDGLNGRGKLGGGVVVAGQRLQVGHRIVKPERDRDRLGGLAMNQDFEPPRLGRVETGTGRHREHRGIIHPLDAFAIGIDPLIVALGEAERFSVLDDAQAIEAMTLVVAKEFVALEVVAAGGGDEDRLRLIRHPALEILEIHHADQVAADRGGREQRGGEVDIKVVGTAERHVELSVGRAGLAECGGDIAHGDPPARPPRGDKEFPGFAREAVNIERRGSGRGDRGRNAGCGTRHRDHGGCRHRRRRPRDAGAQHQRGGNGDAATGNCIHKKS